MRLIAKLKALLDRRARAQREERAREVAQRDRRRGVHRLRVNCATGEGNALWRKVAAHFVNPNRKVSAAERRKLLSGKALRRDGGDTPTKAATLQKLRDRLDGKPGRSRQFERRKHTAGEAYG